MSRLFVALSMTTVLVLSTIAGCGKSEAEKFNDQAAAGLSAWAHHRMDEEGLQAGPPAVGAEPVHQFLEEKEQAAQAAVPEVSEAQKPTSAIMIMHCRKLVGLGFIDGAGGFHDVPLDGLTKAIVQDLLQSVPADKVSAYVIPCGSDGTPI